MSDNEIEEEILEDIEEPELSFSESLVESLPSLHLEGGDLPGLHLEGGDLLGVNLEGGDLPGVHLEGGDLPGLHLVGGDQPVLPADQEASRNGATTDEAFRLDWESKCDVEEEDKSPGGPEPVSGLASLDSQQEGGIRQVSPSDEPPVDRAEIPSRPGSPNTTSVSPMFSNLTDFSSASRSDIHNDRSLSEVSLSIPRLAVVAVNSDQPVSSLVRQFSHRELGLCSPSSNSSPGQFQSLPPRLDGRSESGRPPTKPSALYAPSSPPGERAAEGPRDKSGGNVAKLINQFSIESSDEREAPLKRSLPADVLQPVISSIASIKDVALSLPDGDEMTEYPGSLGDGIDVGKESSLPAGDSRNGTSSSVYVLPIDRGSAQAPGDVSGPQDLELLCNIAFPDSACAGDDLNSWDRDGGDVNTGTPAENEEVDDEREQSVAPLPGKTSPETSLRCDDNESHLDAALWKLHKSVRCRPDSPYETNDTSEELLEIDIGESDHEMFAADLSDASEIILGFISKSPISAITERTEESAQEKSSAVSEEGGADKSDRSLNCNEMEELKSGEDDKGASREVPGPTGYFPSAFLSIENDVASSQFTGMSSMQGEESIVQNQLFSIGTASDALHPSSSQSGQLNAVKMRKPNAKSKLPTKLNVNVRPTLRGGDRCLTPPLSLHGQCAAPQGPLKTCLQRVTSKSMHNLALGAGGKPRAPVLQNRSFSLSTDHLERQSPRAKSLSPGPGYEQRGRSAIDGRPHSSMARRCLSAVALNRTDSQASMKRNQSVSLSRLNRSRSSSMTSVSSWRRADYSHVSSKVRQYIRDMKDKDLRNSTRSLPATPAKKITREPLEERELRRIVLEDLLLRDLSYLEEEEVPEAVSKLRNQIRANLKGAGQGDVKVLDQLLQLWAMERKLRHASDTTLAALQGHYNDLNTLYAEKQNEIDRLRFRRRLSASCHNTPPATPHFQTSPNTPTRRLSVHTTPPNTPNAPSLSPSLLSNLNRTSSTPAVDPSMSITLEPNEPSACAEGGVEEVTLETWIKDANGVLRRVKEFALLEGSSALQQSERTVIWNSILNQYWRLSSQFPLLSLLPGSQQSGALVQNLGQAIAGTASRFQLEIVPSKTASPSDRGVEESFVLTCGGASGFADAEGSRRRGGDDSRDRSSKRPQGNQRTSMADDDHAGANKDLQSDCLKEEGNEEKAKKKNKEDSFREPKMEEEREEKGMGISTMNIELLEEEEELLRRENNAGTDSEATAGKDGEDALSNAPSPTPSHESMKTVGPLEKNQSELRAGGSGWLRGSSAYPDVTGIAPPTLGRHSHSSAHWSCCCHLPADKQTTHFRSRSLADRAPPNLLLYKRLQVTMWQESLIGSVVPHGSYPSSSNVSPAASLLSLGSSQPFEAGHLADLDLKGFHPLHSSTALGLGENESGEGAGLALPLTAEGGELDDVAGTAMDKVELPQSAWKGGATTHHLALGRSAIKARDLDSGCPGSERSTKVSQIASLEMIEDHVEGSSLHPGETKVIGEGMWGGMGPCREVTPEGIPSQECLEKEETAKVVDQEVKGGFENDSIKIGDCDKENAGPRVAEGKGKVSSPRDDRGEMSGAKMTKERPKDHSSRHKKRAHRPDQPGGDDIKMEVTSSRQPKPRRPALGKYDEKYTSGNLSSSSEKSTGSSRSSSSAEIHSNISRLKRDLNFLKSQMMNLTSEVLQEKRRNSFSARRRDGARTDATRTARTNVGCFRFARPVGLTTASQGSVSERFGSDQRWGAHL